MSASLPAAVIGAGPNGLAAAVTLARAGVPVTVFEASTEIGGGTRTAEWVRAGVLHDVCSAIHPMALATPFFTRFQLEQRITFAVPDRSYAQPLTDSAGRPLPAAIAHRDLDRTAEELGRDGSAYARFYRPLLSRLEGVLDFAMSGSVLRPPSNPLAALVTGLRTAEQGTPLWGMRFSEDWAPALLTGVAAHSVGRMPRLAGAAVGVVLGALGHASGWPVPVGGSRSISDALADDLLAHGGRFVTGHRITSLDELSEFGVKIFDTSARDLARIAGDALPRAYRRALERFRYGDGAAKVDFVLDGPIPWADPGVSETPTVHVGGTRREMRAAELAVSRGTHAERPYVLLAQPDEWDPTRNDPGVRAIWSYTHVPHGSDRDVSETVIRQIERFAPGFRDRIVAVRTTTARELSQYNPNYIGGDFSAGQVNLGQLLRRPTLSPRPWKTPVSGVYLGSSSTPPGPGVHGVSGWNAARCALREVYGLDEPHLGIV